VEFKTGGKIGLRCLSLPWTLKGTVPKTNNRLIYFYLEGGSVMRKESKAFIWVLSVTICACMFLVSCAQAPFSKETPPDAQAQSGISYSIIPSAKVTKIAYYISEFKGKNTVFFEINLKNITDRPKRFKVMVDIPGGPSSAAYYPRKGKPPVLKAGQQHMEPIPMVIYDKLPTSFLLVVKELPVD
jgi:hypothetical protein